MLVKKRTKTMEIDGLIALLKRMGKGDERRTKIEERLYNLQAGFGGESQYDKYLTEFRPDYPHAILHDVTLCDDNTFFKMDSILITPAFILISEVKNIAEKIVVKSNPLQFIKEYPSGKRVPLKNPIVEVERKMFHLNNWLKKHKITIPIKGLIAFAYNNELLIEEPPSMHIMFTYEVAAHLRTLSVTQRILDKPKIHSLAQKMVRNHKEFHPFPLINKYNIHLNDIKTGVFCPICSGLSMMWEHQKWRCKSCGHTGKKEHQNALTDWSMLIKENITNKEFCYFTRLNDRHIAKRLLATSSAKLTGNGRGSRYNIVLCSEKK
ncbi:nuclease-related domain-containing protein [Sporosarcina sp. FSL W8-0480]|uniref:nuclease-related domain-containing protein n=1 Tax=Sporosarcina sp. FSL W8-0480 TaxID=2954701 RepID=UPI0030D9C7CD